MPGSAPDAIGSFLTVGMITPAEAVAKEFVHSCTFQIPCWPTRTHACAAQIERHVRRLPSARAGHGLCPSRAVAGARLPEIGRNGVK
ncbi:hypothetical protein ACWT_3681 [Actinoplanes sp. SE50]|nr:hypothetical protein ACPL_3809 [Actinoplanes sp. SE50/110]ATO83096.1 hypothetical protein ACWT_3681 [Actinoplanes sp. SE50]SLM00503.1 hypothetical protein ACSP50_3736 [Actinoplanes sp. SE50/110]